MSLQQLQLEYTLPSAPSTTRAIPTRLSTHGTVLAYGSGLNVVVRDLANPNDTFLCALHTSPVTAVCLSPSGTMVASGDESGTLHVWTRQPQPRAVLQSKALQGAVRDIAWAHDETRLVMVGEGKSSFAAAMTITGSDMGSINGHAKNIFTCDVCGEPPFRIVTGGADALVGFYEGVPLQFKCNLKGHTNTVTCVRYSPDMRTIATASSSPEVILLDGATGARRAALATGHTGTIYALSWSPDGARLATASADRSVKVLDAATGATLFTHAFGPALASMPQGLACTPTGPLVLSFGGALTQLAADGAVADAFFGHQRRVLFLHAAADGALLSVGADGAWVWRGSPKRAAALPLAADGAVGAAVGGGALCVIAGGAFQRVPLAPDAPPGVVSGAASGAVAVAALSDGRLALIGRTRLTLLAGDGRHITAEPLDRLDAASAAAWGEIVAVGGEGAVRLYHMADTRAERRVEFAGKHVGTVSCVAFAHDGTRVASGDANRNIFVWSTADGAVLFDGLVFHTLRVTALAFAPGNRGRLCSAGMDASIIVWDLEGKRRRTQDAAHRGGVSAVAWVNENTVVSGGSDFCVRQWRIPDWDTMLEQ